MDRLARVQSQLCVGALPGGSAKLPPPARSSAAFAQRDEAALAAPPYRGAVIGLGWMGLPSRGAVKAFMHVRPVHFTSNSAYKVYRGRVITTLQPMAHAWL